MKFFSLIYNNSITLQIGLEDEDARFYADKSYVIHKLDTIKDKPNVMTVQEFYTDYIAPKIHSYSIYSKLPVHQLLFKLHASKSKFSLFEINRFMTSNLDDLRYHFSSCASLLGNINTSFLLNLNPLLITEYEDLMLTTINLEELIEMTEYLEKYLDVKFQFSLQNLKKLRPLDRTFEIVAKYSPEHEQALSESAHNWQRIAEIYLSDIAMALDKYEKDLEAFNLERQNAFLELLLKSSEELEEILKL